MQVKPHDVAMPLEQPEVTLQCGGEMGDDRVFGSLRIACPAGIDDGEMLADRAQGQRRRQLAVETDQPEIIVDPPVAGVDQLLAEGGEVGLGFVLSLPPPQLKMAWTTRN
jgi:hypothetical protein